MANEIAPGSTGPSALWMLLPATGWRFFLILKDKKTEPMLTHLIATNRP
jgi:hypothetical protein